MNLIEILTNAATVIVPMVAFLGWIYSRIDKKFEKIDQKFEKIDQRFERLENQINDVRRDIQSIDSRVSRIEGQLSPYHWEPKIKQKEE
jgi:predicted  nucleic acid-binding Zn-ribbon protein